MMMKRKKHQLSLTKTMFFFSMIIQFDFVDIYYEAEVKEAIINAWVPLVYISTVDTQILI